MPLGQAAQKLLKSREKRTSDSRYVFPHAYLVDRPLSLPTSTMWRVIRREAELPPKLRLHDLRHNFASHALLAGESLLVAGSILGHSRPSMTARYAHLADDSLLQGRPEHRISDSKSRGGRRSRGLDLVPA